MKNTLVNYSINFFFFTITDPSCLKLIFTTGDNDDNGDDDGDFIDDSGETDR